MRYVYCMGHPTALWVLIALVAAGQSQPTWAQGGAESCGSLSNGYGPYDYTNSVHRLENLPVVERAHFNDDVYHLRRGAGRNESPLGDLEYTLRAFPNHHLALEAMTRLHRKLGTNRLSGGLYSLTCWFERAKRFKPSDGMVDMIHGVHLFRIGDFEAAERPLRKALELMPNSAEAHYNLGLVYLRLGNYAAARMQAAAAYEMGFPLPGLRDQLMQVGQWRSSE